MKLNIKTLFYIILTTSFLVHILFIAQNEFYPTLPETRQYKKLLKVIDFPLKFQVCAFQVNDDTQMYQSFGYKDIINFFRGRSLYNSSLIGWGGHAENQTKIASVEGKRFLYLIYKYQTFFRGNEKCFIFLDFYF